MKGLQFFACLMLAASGFALAQGESPAQAQAQTNAQQNTSVSADKTGAKATHNDSSSTAVQTKQSQANLAQGTEMNATLSRPVDSRKAKPGDQVSATTTRDTKSNGQVVIPRGSKLVGHVTEARARGKSQGEATAQGSAAAAGSATGSAANSAAGSASGSAEAALGIVFDRAILKDGREIPVNATIQAIAASSANAASQIGGTDSSLSGAAMGSGSGAGSASAGGLLGNTAGAVTGTVSGAAQATAGGAIHALSRSPGATGGLSGSGVLNSGSHGVFGLDGVNLTSATGGTAEGSLITSTGRSVQLDGGTRMLLVSGAQVSKSANQASEPTPAPKPTKPTDHQ